MNRISNILIRLLRTLNQSSIFLRKGFFEAYINTKRQSEMLFEKVAHSFIDFLTFFDYDYDYECEMCGLEVGICECGLGCNVVDNPEIDNTNNDKNIKIDDILDKILENETCTTENRFPLQDGINMLTGCTVVSESAESAESAESVPVVESVESIPVVETEVAEVSDFEFEFEFVEN
jgi:hypothetical protein